MRNYTQVAIVSLLIIAVLYLISSFIAWEFNPNEWNIAGRFLLAMFSLLSVGALIAIKEESE